MKGQKTESRRKMRRMIEGYRDTIARLVDVNNEQQKEISELRELLTEIESEIKNIDAWARYIRGSEATVRMLIRSYAEEHGVFWEQTAEVNE